MDTKSLNLQRNRALYLVSKTRQRVLAKANDPYLPAKMKKLAWMERYIKQYKWMPQSFRVMCRMWSLPQTRPRDYGLNLFNPHFIERGKQWTTAYAPASQQGIDW